MLINEIKKYCRTSNVRQLKKLKIDLFDQRVKINSGNKLLIVAIVEDHFLERIWVKNTKISKEDLQRFLNENEVYGFKRMTDSGEFRFFYDRYCNNMPDNFNADL